MSSWHRDVRHQWSLWLPFKFKRDSHQYIKDSKVEICREDQPTVSTRGRSTIDTFEAITSFVDLEGGIDDRCWEDQQSTLTFAWKDDCLMCWSWGDWWSLLRGSTVNFNFCVKRRLPHVLILGGINHRCWEDQQSTLTFMWKGDRLMCWSWGGN